MLRIRPYRNPRKGYSSDFKASEFFGRKHILYRGKEPVPSKTRSKFTLERIMNAFPPQMEHKRSIRLFLSRGQLQKV